MPILKKVSSVNTIICDLLHEISPKSDNKCGKYENKFTAPTFTKLTQLHNGLTWTDWKTNGRTEALAI
jgi:hypothetical protein